MDHQALVKEGNHLNAVLAIQERIMKDPTTLPEQARVIKATGLRHAERLDKLADLMDSDCKCGHAKHGHINGMGLCNAKEPLAGAMGCPCAKWEVDEP